VEIYCKLTQVKQVLKWKHIAMLNKFFSLDSLIHYMMEIE